MVLDRYPDQHMHIIAEALTGYHFEFFDAVTAIAPGAGGDLCGELVTAGAFFNEIEVMISFGRIVGMAGDICHHPVTLTRKSVPDSTLYAGR